MEAERVDFNKPIHRQTYAEGYALGKADRQYAVKNSVPMSELLERTLEKAGAHWSLSYRIGYAEAFSIDL